MLDLSPFLDPRRNPFNLLGLSVQADAKTIRHRREDIEAALAAEDVNEAFPHVHSPGVWALPGLDELNAAFRALDDPKSKFLHSFFWFWPVKRGEIDLALVSATLGTPEGLERGIEMWKVAGVGPGLARTSAFHNTALAHAFLARYGEARLMSESATRDDTEKIRESAEQHWDESVHAWETIAADETFWRGLANKIAAIDDPRMSQTFLKRIRLALPTAVYKARFDSVERFAERGLIAAAEARMAAMYRPQRWNVDVRGMVEDRFCKIDRRSNMLINASRKDPARFKNGLSIARHILDESVIPVRQVRALLGADAPEARGFCDRIARCVRDILADCQKDDSEETSTASADLLFRCQPLATDPVLVALIDSDLELYLPDFVDRAMARYHQMTRPIGPVGTPLHRKWGKDSRGSQGRSGTCRPVDSNKPRVHPDRTSFPEDEMPDENMSPITRFLWLAFAAMILSPFIVLLGFWVKSLFDSAGN